MPKFEPKAIQKELDSGQIWPFYWIYGPEKLKSREIVKRIRQAVLGSQGSQSLWSWGEENKEGSEVDAASLVDSALSPSLGGGIRLIIVRDAHAIKNPEDLAELFGNPDRKENLSSVCVCLSKDLDARKKFSKLLLEKAAVVPCDEVPEAQRQSWIQFLAKRRNIELSSSLVMRLYSLDPWSLDIVDQELEKYTLAGLSSEVILGGGVAGGTDHFIESFFSRDLRLALPSLQHFSNSPDESLPLLGLLNWNTRQLAGVVADREQKTRYSKLNPYLADKFVAWSKKWKLEELIELQHELFELDFQLKQTPLAPLGLWSLLVTRFCPSQSS